MLVAALSERGTEVAVGNGGLGRLVFWPLLSSSWDDLTRGYKVGVVPSPDLVRRTQVAGSPRLILIGECVPVAVAIVR